MFKVEAIGNLGADVKRNTEQGSTFYSFKLANTDRWKDAQGNEHEETTWISVTINEKRGEVLAPYLLKGRKVFVRGRAKTRLYSSQIDRRMKASVDVMADEVELIGGQPDDVPRQVVNPVDGSIYDVYKAYFIDQSRFSSKEEWPQELTSKDNARRFRVDNLFLYPIKEDETNGADQETQEISR